VSSVPIYNTGLRLVSLFADMMNALMGSTLLAGFSQVEGRDGPAAVKGRFLFALRFSVPLALFGVGIIGIIGPTFIERWVGPAFHESGRVTQMLLLPYGLWLMQFPVGSLFLSMNRYHIITTLTFASAVVNVILSVSLSYWLGFYGVVWGTLIEMSVMYGLVVPILVSRLLSMSIWAYYKVLLIPLVKLGLVMAALGMVVQPFCKPDYLTLAVAATVFTVGATIGGGWLLVTAEERSRLLGRLGWR
jgi:O-antigen/teichoic acid export membrane protein